MVVQNVIMWTTLEMLPLLNWNEDLVSWPLELFIAFSNCCINQKSESMHSDRRCLLETVIQVAFGGF